MAAFAAGIFNHSMASAQGLTGTDATPMASSAAGASTTSTASATISANDFLTLLVTEMKNQDPTANTDPNEYINQLVNVNSLEQLININQTLSTALGSSGTSSNGNGSSQTATVASMQSSSSSSGASGQVSSTPSSGGTLSAVQSGATGAGMAGNLEAISSAAKRVSGNLSVPDANPAARSMARALDGHSHVGSTTGGLLGAR